jgi:hypothetical protein
MELVTATLAAESKPIMCEMVGAEANANTKPLFNPITRVAVMPLVMLTLAVLSKLRIIETPTTPVMLCPTDARSEIS